MRAVLAGPPAAQARTGHTGRPAVRPSSGRPPRWAPGPGRSAFRVPAVPMAAGAGRMERARGMLPPPGPGLWALFPLRPAAGPASTDPAPEAAAPGSGGPAGAPMRPGRRLPATVLPLGTAPPRPSFRSPVEGPPSGPAGPAALLSVPLLFWYMFFHVALTAPPAVTMAAAALLGRRARGASAAAGGVAR